MNQPSTVEKGGSGFEGVTLLLCENPLPPIEEAIEPPGSGRGPPEP